MKLRLRSVAEADVAEAIQWYEQQAPGLGEQFLRSLEVTLRRIVEHPQLYREVLPRARRAFFPRLFPYMVLYTIDGIDGDTISVYAVIHPVPELDREQGLRRLLAAHDRDPGPARVPAPLPVPLREPGEMQSMTRRVILA